jgi:hypothetical protein
MPSRAQRIAIYLAPKTAAACDDRDAAAELFHDPMPQFE